MTPFLIVLSAPSGGGKTTIARALLSRRTDVRYSVSATTRAPRPEERDGVDYRFLSRAEFERRRREGEFLEWTEYAGEWYGTLARDVERLLGNGRHVLMDIDVTGARQLRERRGNVVSIFILPPSADALLERLGGRNAEAPAQLRRRLRQAVEELRDAPAYEYLVVNDEQERAVTQVSAIIDAEARRVSRAADLADRVARLADDVARLVEQLEE